MDSLVRRLMDDQLGTASLTPIASIYQVQPPLPLLLPTALSRWSLHDAIPHERPHSSLSSELPGSSSYQHPTSGKFTAYDRPGPQLLHAK